jgi:hypothetical protein
MGDKLRKWIARDGTYLYKKSKSATIKNGCQWEDPETSCLFA